MPFSFCHLVQILVKHFWWTYIGNKVEGNLMQINHIYIICLFDCIFFFVICAKFLLTFYLFWQKVNANQPLYFFCWVYRPHSLHTCTHQWFLTRQSLIHGQWLLTWSLAVLSLPKSKHRAVAEPLSVKGVFFFFFGSHSRMHHCYPFCFSWDFFSLNYISVFDVMSWRHIC